MPTLKEIKGRIGSVQNTLKITSAMKLVSSAKLRKAQTAIENMRPYQAKLQEILELAGGLAADSGVIDGQKDIVVVAISSNSSLCGAFNANVIAKAKGVLNQNKVVKVYSIGRKMADAMRKAGYPSPKDYTSLSEHPSYAPVADLVEELMEERSDGHISNVLLVYNHFVSTGKQVSVVEPLFEVDGSKETSGTEAEGDKDVILEPSRKELLDALYPKTVKLKLFAALLDSAAAEHAARTVAMQTATDNGEDLLSELTLQYNKGRQQKITNEILDLAGGQARE